MSCKDRKDLAEQAFSALKWNYGGTLVRSGAQILIGIVLARILGPEPFGLVAIAWIVISLGYLVADFGFEAALVQRQILSNDEVRYTFTLQVLIGLGLTALVYGSASLIAQVFKQPEIVPVLQVLSLIFVFQSLGQTATSLLKRNLDFRSVQMGQVLSNVVSYVLLGIPLAYMGFEVWSLAIAQLSQSLMYALVTYFRVRHPIKPLLKIHAAGFFGFGMKVTITNLVNWMISNMDNVFVGRFFGAVSLGLYSRTYVLMNTPTNNLVAMLQGILFSAYSKTQDDLAKLKRVYLASVSIIATIALPVFGSIAVVPHTVIEGVYGKNWLNAVPFLVPLALAMPFFALMALAGPLIWGKGKVERELRVQAIVAALFIVVLSVTSKISVVAMAWGVFAVYVVRFIFMTKEVLQVTGASWQEILISMRGSVLILIVAASVVSGTDAILVPYDAISSLIRLIIDAFAAATAAFLLFLALPRVVLSPETIWVSNRFLQSLPPSLCWILVHINGAKSKANG